MYNPLLESTELPPFGQIEAEHMLPAIEQCLAANRASLQQLLAQPSFSWQSLVTPLEDLSARLSATWSPVGHLNSVMSSDAIRQAYNACLPLLSEYSTELGQNLELYQAFKGIRDAGEWASLDPVQQRLVTHALRDFELSGIALAQDKKARYGDIMQRLSELNAKFEANLLDATDAWFKHLPDDSRLQGVPESARAAMQDEAQRRELDGWVVTLKFPSYWPIMAYAEDRALRAELYRAYVTRASELGANPDWDNSAIMVELVALRQELAQLLGFQDYAEYSLSTKMAESSAQVLGFLRDLTQKARPQAERELQELRAFAAEQLGIEQLEAWDAAFASEQLRQFRYELSEEELRPYFPAGTVLSGLFEIVGRLYGIQIDEDTDAPRWHPDVRFFRISQNGQSIGAFYFDLYARQGKRGGAWMDDCRGRWLSATGELQLPCAYLVCNFNGPTDGKPALFTHGEVETLFHEFGHGLHHLLTRIHYPSLAGINGVPWDAVELPSQFLENWCWQDEALALISGHVETGEVLPSELLARMKAARGFQAAMQALRQLEFSLFDFELHQAGALDLAQILSLQHRIRSEVAVLTPPEFNRFAHGFSHIFAGGYAAGYYSYLWAEVLSSDAFSRFEEEGIFNAQVGAEFRRCILERGGSDEPMNLFKEFRGREPQIDALLRHRGIL